VNPSEALIRWERATDIFSLSMGQSVLVTEGAQWQRQRRMLQPGFTPKRVAGYAQLMKQATREALDVMLNTPSDTSHSNLEPLWVHPTSPAFHMAHLDAPAQCAPCA